MSEEEKKIKEMEEFGIRLIDSPSETIALASPTKLKLQSLTFMIIGKVERYFLNSMLKQTQEAQKLAAIGLKNITTMSNEEKEAFTNKLDSNVAILTEKLRRFDENYQRVIGHGKRSLRIPTVNFSKLATSDSRVEEIKAINNKKTEEMTNIVDAYKQMNDVFTASKDAFSNMAKPLKRDVEISKVEQENIRKSVYQALKGATNKKVEDFAQNFDEKSSAKLDDVANKIVTSKNKEQELDNFFENISPVKGRNKLETNDLDQLLNGGQAKGKDISPKPVKEDNNGLILTGENPSLSSEPVDVFEGKPSLIMQEWLKNQSYNNDEKVDNVESVVLTSPKTNDDIFGKPLTVSNKENNNSDTLSDKELEGFANKLTGKQLQTASKEETDSNNIEFDINNIETIPDMDELRAQLAESMREREEKRKAKAQAQKEYEDEKRASEREADELKESKIALEKINEEIKRKKEEQKSIEALNKQVEKALEIQRSIAENRKAALEEEEEAKKYREMKNAEVKNQNNTVSQKEQIQSSLENLRSENNHVNSSLKEQREKLEAAKRELKSLTGISASQTVIYGYQEPNSKVDLFATPTKSRK